MVKYAPPRLHPIAAEEEEYQRSAASDHGRRTCIPRPGTNSKLSPSSSSSKKRNSNPSASFVFFKKKKLVLRNKIRSVVQAFMEFLTSDSFMYGPLIYPSPSSSSPRLSKRKLSVPSSTARNILATPSELIERGNGMTSTLAPLESPVTPSATPSSGLHSVSTLSRKVIYKTPGGSNVSKSHEGTPSSASYFLRRFNNRNEPTLSEMNYSSPRDDNTFAGVIDQSILGSQTFTPLHKDAAIEVARKLVKKVGGRFSKELGIYVDSHDAEVERWFLATTFLSNPSDIEKVKLLFKKLQIMGISKIQDVLVANKSELENVFESMIGDNRGSHLLKIANAMPTGVCSLKHISYLELKRELENLPGYSKQAAQLFMREMRGVWIGATPELDTGTKNSAKHLHLIPNVKVDGLEETSSLLRLAQDAGLDERDFEVALLKLNEHHSQQYTSCIGGLECDFIRTVRSILIA